jgi:hypothetical protein
MNWSWAWFTYGRGARLITGIPPEEEGKMPARAGLGRAAETARPSGTMLRS